MRVDNKTIWKEFTKGIIRENPTFVQVLGMCPTLATTTNAINGFGMGVATFIVLVLSNVVISSIRKVVPNRIRIPIFIVVIASFVTVIDMLMHAFTYELWETLALYVPLIVVNCIIMGRAEAFASKNTVKRSFIDGLGMGVGFTTALTLLGATRELLGSGTIFGITIWGNALNIFVMILPPGGFLMMGLLLGMFNAIGQTKKKA